MELQHQGRSSKLSIRSSRSQGLWRTPENYDPALKLKLFKEISQTLFCTLACTVAVSGKNIALPNPAIVWNIAPATPWSFLGKLCVVKRPKHGYRVSAPKAARHIAGRPYAK